MAKQLFINLPVKDLKKTITFFKKLGFTFNKKFTDKNAACMIIGKDIFAMLITENFFENFTKKKIADAKKTTEVIVAVSFEQRKDVDRIFNFALKAGGKQFRPTQDMGWMYLKTFEDLDGHIWELFHMDAKKMPKA